VAGAIDPEKVRQNATRMSVRIPAALWAELKQQDLVAASAPVPG
jgi:D-threo-aldose 1-dehydrogenase